MMLSGASCDSVELEVRTYVHRNKQTFKATVFLMGGETEWKCHKVIERCMGKNTTIKMF